MFKQWKEKYLILTMEGSLLVCRDAESPPDQVVALQSGCEAIVEGREILDLPRLPPGGRRDCCFALILPQNKFLLLLSDGPEDCRSSRVLCPTSYQALSEHGHPPPPPLQFTAFMFVSAWICVKDNNLCFYLHSLWLKLVRKVREVSLHHIYSRLLLFTFGTDFYSFIVWISLPCGLKAKRCITSKKHTLIMNFRRPVPDAPSFKNVLHKT